MQTQKFGVDAFDALFSKSIEFQKYVTNIETAVKDKYNTAIWSVSEDSFTLLSIVLSFNSLLCFIPLISSASLSIPFCRILIFQRVSSALSFVQ